MSSQHLTFAVCRRDPSWQHFPLAQQHLTLYLHKIPLSISCRKWHNYENVHLLPNWTTWSSKNACTTWSTRNDAPTAISVNYQHHQLLSCSYSAQHTILMPLLFSIWYLADMIHRGNMCDLLSIIWLCMMHRKPAMCSILYLLCTGSTQY